MFSGSMMHWLALFEWLSPESVTHWLEAGGYLVLFGLLFACGLGLPLPEDIPLMAAGIFISQDKMHLLPAAVIGWCGIIGGDCVLYYMGKRFGLEITRVPFIGRHLTKQRIVKAELLFDKWGIWVVAVGRLFAGIRGAMVVAAGATRFNFLKFILADGLAAIVSGGLFIALGYWVGGSVSTIKEKIKGVEHWVYGSIIVLVVAAVVFIVWRRKRHKPAVVDAALTKAVQEAEKRPPHGADIEAKNVAELPPESHPKSHRESR